MYFSNSYNDSEYYTATDTIYKDTVFVDTLYLNTLTNSIYYKVLSFDKNYNPSALSKAVKAIKPDTVFPVRVVFDGITQPSDKVIVSWENSPSDDASYMELYRQIDDTGKVVLLETIEIKKKTPTKYTDPYLYSGEHVQYFMKIYDEVGNATESKTSIFRTKGERPGCISHLRVIVENTEKSKQIRLRWTNEKTASVSRYAIYRKEDGGRMLPIASVRANNVFYEDKDIAIGSKYVYIVRPISTERVCPAVYSEEVTFEGTIK